MTAVIGVKSAGVAGYGVAAPDRQARIDSRRDVRTMPHVAAAKTAAVRAPVILSYPQVLPTRLRGVPAAELVGRPARALTGFGLATVGLGLRLR